MLFFINILNLISCGFLYLMDYRVVKGTDLYDLRYFLLFLILSIVYKIFIFNKYGVNYTIFSIYQLYWSKSLNMFDKVLNVILIILNTFIFCGLSVLFLKVLLIEMNFNLLGRIKLLPWIFSDLHLVKIYTIIDKEAFIKILLNQALLNNDFKEKLDNLSSSDLENFINHLKYCVSESVSLFEVKNKFEIVCSRLISTNNMFDWVNIVNKGVYLLFTGGSFFVTYFISDYFFPKQTLAVRNNFITHTIGKVLNYFVTTSTSPLSKTLITNDLTDRIGKLNKTKDGVSLKLDNTVKNELNIGLDKKVLDKTVEKEVLDKKVEKELLEKELKKKSFHEEENFNTDLYTIPIKELTEIELSAFDKYLSNKDYNMSWNYFIEKENTGNKTFSDFFNMLNPDQGYLNYFSFGYINPEENMTLKQYMKDNNVLEHWKHWKQDTLTDSSLEEEEEIENKEPVNKEEEITIEKKEEEITIENKEPENK